MSQSVPVLRPAIGDDQLPAGLSHLQRFKLAAAAGFEGVEMRTSLHSDEVDEIRETAITAGIQIHSVKSVLSWQFPLSSPDRKVAARGVDELLIALNNAHRWGADTVLVVAGIVDAQTSHEQAYVRSQEIIRREVLPVAEELGIVLAIENVWSGFLISPVEYARYIDEFDSPWVRAYLDVGNMIFGYPEHWVRTVGARTIKLHIKDLSFEMAKKRFAWSLIG
ncbi:MAG TPA: sugar phosphate isomerase/epimerase family protein, partial [Blastocatellia bacterium]|nr:sugar phosphate isomerase/epimerase family protein [Blastocatellia bacterium]